MAIEIYTSMLCGYCHRAKKLLKSKGQEFEDHGVDFKPELRAEMAERGGRGLHSAADLRQTARTLVVAMSSTLWKQVASWMGC